METKELISSYDEINDTFVGKIYEKNGYHANYDISEGIFLNIDENNLPVSVYINNASDVLNIKKYVLKYCDLSIFIDCNGSEINFKLCAADRMIYNTKSINLFDSPQFSYLIKTNWGCKMSYLNELDEELFDELEYEYEDELQDVDVDKIKKKKKNNISDYIFENPDDYIPFEPSDDIDFVFEENIVPDEMLEKLEPKDKILDFVDK